MFWTGVTRPSESILDEQDKKNKLNKKTLSLMKEQALNLSVILGKKEFSLEEVGEIMDKGWNYKKQLASKISNNSIDDYYSKAIKSGALGGKISGAGGGGFLLLIAEKQHHKKIIKEMNKVGLSLHSFGLDSLGSVVYEIE